MRRRRVKRSGGRIDIFGGAFITYDEAISSRESKVRGRVMKKSKKAKKKKKEENEEEKRRGEKSVRDAEKKKSREKKPYDDR